MKGEQSKHFFFSTCVFDFFSTQIFSRLILICAPRGHSGRGSLDGISTCPAGLTVFIY